MRSYSIVRVLGCMTIGLISLLSAAAQQGSGADTLPASSLDGASTTLSRVTRPVDEADLVTLSGNTHMLARPQFDQGAVDPQLPMQRIMLTLKRSPEQDAALEQLLAQQYDPASSNFHHWLQPEEFGKLYGPSDNDIQAVTHWLQIHGFQIDQVSKGRITIEFSGTAAQVQEAFHTSIHHYLIDGRMHLANTADPQIPAALAPVIVGIASLHDFFPVPQSVLGRKVKRDTKTGKITSLEPPAAGLKSDYGFTDQNGNSAEDVTPYDFAAIYNLTPLWNAGITGKGQTIAISAVTDVNASDITAFRKSFGLTGFTGTIKLVHNGSDPGIVQSALVENTLDTEWSGAAAPDAVIAVVVSASTSSTFGGILSDSYIVDNPSLATIMSASYGGCEVGLGTAGNSQINAIYQQGASEGISMFESSGDQGSTGCDNSDATTYPAPAGYGLQVNGDASSPYITAVGGTDFTWQGSTATYWKSSNGSNDANAIGYIPEVPWNSTCSSSYLLTAFFNPNYGYTSTEQVCNSVEGLGASDLIRVVGGSGGVSACTTSTGGTFSSCSGGYAKPSWQKGTGVPADGKRDLPDVSLFASSGYPDGLNGSAYLICVASNSPSGSCNYTDPSYIVAQEVGGTSVSSPAMAGIMALVQQKQQKAQGLANPVFYALAAKDSLTSCNSSTVRNGNTCNFYDVTSSTNAMVCTSGSRNCVVKSSGDTYGIVSGYNSTTGFDLTTGLGSVNATNLVNNWSSAVSSPTLTLSLSPTSIAFGSAAVNSTSAAKVVTLKNTGTAALTLSSETVTAPFLKSATTCGTSLAAGATCTVSVEFKPTAATSSTGTLKVASNGTSSPASVTLTGTGTASTAPAITLTPGSVAFPNTIVGSTSAAQVVTMKNTGTAAATISSIVLGGTNATSFLQLNNCPATLAAGASCSLYLAFKPASAAALTSTLSVTDNATGSPQKVTLTGTGVAMPSLKLSATSITFPTTRHGTTSAAQTVTLTNSGTAVLNLTAIILNGSNPTDFAALNTCGETLAPAASCAVYLAFKPVAASAYSATLTLTDNGAASPQVVTLKGTGN